ncbi:MAG: flagellin [Verrucomicrobiota bacterium]
MLILGSSNNAALLTAQAVEQAADAVDTSVGRLSSGRRMVHNYDDAGALAVSIRMAAAFNRLSATQSNLLNLQSFKTVQEQSLSELGDIITRLGELKTLAADPTKNLGDIKNYAKEYAALSTQAREISERKFNGVRLFSASTEDVSLSVATSEDGSETMEITNPSLSVQTLIDVITDKQYSIVKGDFEWGEAKVAAEAQGGILGGFPNEADWSQAIFQLGEAALTADPLWVGLTQTMNAEDVDKNWKWLSGEQASGAGARWAAGQPDNGGGGESTVAESADGLAWNQPASECSTSGHVGDELLSNGDGVVSGYVIQYVDSNGATKYQAVTGTALSWDAARLAAYGATRGGLLPAGTPVNLGASTTNVASKTVTVTSTAGLQVGMVVTGAGGEIPAGTKVTAIAGNNVTLSNFPTATGATTLSADTDPLAHLATLKSTAEYAAAKTQLEAQGIGANTVLWLGGYQSGGSLTEANAAANWHWVSDTLAADGLTHAATDAGIGFGALSLHGGELDNRSSGSLGESVAYISGTEGSSYDSTGNPNAGGVKGYLLQKDTVTAVTAKKLDAAMQWVSQHRAKVGAELSAIQSKLERLGNYQSNLEQAEGRITDTDMAQESTNLAKNKVLLQMAMNAFAQANRNESLMLRLLA